VVDKVKSIYLFILCGREILSGLIVDTLLRRSRSFRETALFRFKRGDYDLVCFDVEQSLQLKIKALLYKFFGLETRVHGIRQHLSILYRELSRSNAGRELTDLVEEFMRDNRDLIYIVDISYSDARYSFIEYDVEDARKCLELLDKLDKLLDYI